MKQLFRFFIRRADLVANTNEGRLTEKHWYPIGLGVFYTWSFGVQYDYYRNGGLDGTEKILYYHHVVGPHEYTEDNREKVSGAS